MAIPMHTMNGYSHAYLVVPINYVTAAMLCCDVMTTILSTTRHMLWYVVRVRRFGLMLLSIVLEHNFTTACCRLYR